MKKLAILTVIGSMLLTSVAFAETHPAAAPADAHKQHTAPAAKGDAHGGMDEATMLERLKTKQAHMLMMHDLSNKILAEKDPAKQQALKDQQLEVMKAHHMDMHNRMGQGMMNMPMKH